MIGHGVAAEQRVGQIHEGLNRYVAPDLGVAGQDAGRGREAAEVLLREEPMQRAAEDDQDTEGERRACGDQVPRRVRTMCGGLHCRFMGGHGLHDVAATGPGQAEPASRLDKRATIPLEPVAPRAAFFG